MSLVNICHVLERPKLGFLPQGMVAVWRSSGGLCWAKAAWKQRVGDGNCLLLLDNQEEQGGEAGVLNQDPS